MLNGFREIHKYKNTNVIGTTELTNINETVKLLNTRKPVKTIHSELNIVKIRSKILYLALGASFIYFYYRIQYLNVGSKAKHLSVDLICPLNPGQLEEAQLGELLPRNS